MVDGIGLKGDGGCSLVNNFGEEIELLLRGDRVVADLGEVLELGNTLQSNTLVEIIMLGFDFFFDVRG